MSREHPAVHLHIGAMKTGTTHLQELMTVNADALRSAGYLFPLSDGKYVQTLATRDVMNMTGDPVTLEKARGEWDRTVEEMLGFDGDGAIFSMEFLSFARKRMAGRVVKSLDGADVRGILTVRDAATAIPAQWQQAMQSQRTTSWRAFVDQIMAKPQDFSTWGARTFRRTQDIPRMLNAWLPHIPPERFTVVTLPDPGSPRNLLWERFAETVGVDPAAASRSAPKNNESIGAASAELLRRLNEQVIDIPISDYRGTMRHMLSTRILSDLASSEGKAPTNRAFREFAAETNARTRAAIEETGVHLMGDLDDLPVSVPDDDEGELTSPADANVVTAAAYAYPRLYEHVANRAQRLDKRKHQLTARQVRADLPEEMDEETASARWKASSDPVGTAVDDLAQVCRVSITIARHLKGRAG